MRLPVIATAIVLAATGATWAAQQGLVNVKVGDVTALNDIGIANGTSVQVPVGIAAQVCPDIDANAIAQQKKTNSDIDCTVSQAQANKAFIDYVKKNKAP